MPTLRDWNAIAGNGDNFAGVGEVAASVSDYGLDHLLPSFGGGVRYLLSAENGLNISLDYAYGKESDAVYFFVGESF